MSRLVSAGREALYETGCGVPAPVSSQGAARQMERTDDNEKLQSEQKANASQVHNCVNDVIVNIVLVYLKFMYLKFITVLQVTAGHSEKGL